jgi:hypothetical protein
MQMNPSAPISPRNPTSHMIIKVTLAKTDYSQASKRGGGGGLGESVEILP